jgi:hypothetical protein
MILFETSRPCLSTGHHSVPSSCCGKQFQTQLHVELNFLIDVMLLFFREVFHGGLDHILGAPHGCCECALLSV